MKPRVALKVRTANQVVLRVFMDDEVRQRHRYLQDANLGIPSRCTAMQVLAWGTDQTPPWAMLGVTTAGDSTMIYIGPPS